MRRPLLAPRAVRVLMHDRVSLCPLLRRDGRRRRSAGGARQLSRPGGRGFVLGLPQEAAQVGRGLMKASLRVGDTSRLALEERASDVTVREQVLHPAHERRPVGALDPCLDPVRLVDLRRRWWRQ